MAKVVVTSGEADRGQFTFAGDVVLGRSPECAIRISGPLASRQHARITVADGDYFIEDLDSANGVEVNGSGIRKTQLHDFARIVLGNCGGSCSWRW